MTKNLILKTVCMFMTFFCYCNGMKADISVNKNDMRCLCGDMALHDCEKDEKYRIASIDKGTAIDFIADLCKRFDDFDLVAEMLRYYQINNLNIPNKNGDTLLMLAAYHNCKLVTKWLLIEGVDVNLKNNNEETAMDIAKRQRNMEIVNILTASIKQKWSIEDLLVSAVKENYKPKVGE